jgi:hypothetical protein
MHIGRGNRNTQREPAPAPIFPPQIPLQQTRSRIRAVAMGSQRITSWAMARPSSPVYHANLYLQDVVAYKVLVCYRLGFSIPLLFLEF